MSPTKRQLDALRFIRGYQLAKGYSPCFEEMRAGLGYGSSKTPVFQLLRNLEDRGHLRRLYGRERAIQVLTDIPIPRAPDGAPLYFVEIAG